MLDPRANMISNVSRNSQASTAIFVRLVTFACKALFSALSCTSLSDHVLFFVSTFSRLDAPEGALQKAASVGSPEPSFVNMDKHARNMLKSVSEVIRALFAQFVASCVPAGTVTVIFLGIREQFHRVYRT
jgi:hypothetical protein